MWRREPNTPTEQGRRGRGKYAPADAAHDIEGEGKAGRRPEVFGFAGSENETAVADDQLPRLELAEAARRLRVTGDQDQHAERRQAQAPSGECQRRHACHARYALRNSQITAVSKYATELDVT